VVRNLLHHVFDVHDVPAAIPLAVLSLACPFSLLADPEDLESLNRVSNSRAIADELHFPALSMSYKSPSAVALPTPATTSRLYVETLQTPLFLEDSESPPARLNPKHDVSKERPMRPRA